MEVYSKKPNGQQKFKSKIGDFLTESAYIPEDAAQIAINEAWKPDPERSYKAAWLLKFLKPHFQRGSELYSEVQEAIEAVLT